MLIHACKAKYQLASHQALWLQGRATASRDGAVAEQHFVSGLALLARLCSHQDCPVCKGMQCSLCTFQHILFADTANAPTTPLQAISWHFGIAPHVAVEEEEEETCVCTSLSMSHQPLLFYHYQFTVDYQL